MALIWYNIVFVYFKFTMTKKKPHKDYVYEKICIILQWLQIPYQNKLSTGRPN